jgi:peptidoglycan/LPS O-acetylase OafA/YrhL
VLLFHAGFTAFSGGYVGVDVFFVISGYLITSLILAEKQAGTFSIATFYERRARRILPALFVVMFACLVPAWLWMSPDSLEDFGQSLVAVPLFANNALLFLTSGYFEAAADEKPLLHTWSLAVEEQYYVIFPLMVALLWPLGRRWLAAAIAGIAVISLGLAEWGWRHQPEASFYLAHARAWELLIGAMVAMAPRLEVSKNPRGQLLANTLSYAGLLLVAYSIFRFDSSTPFPSLYTLVPTLGTALILYAATGQTGVARLLRLPVFVGIGLISYSLYLWHQPLLAFARLLGSGEPPLTVTSALLLVAVGLAWLSWRYVETPFRNRSAVPRQVVWRTAATCSVVLIAMGLAAHVAHGFQERMPAAYVSELRHFKVLRTQRTRWLKTSCYLHQDVLAAIGRELQPGICTPQSERARVLVVGDSHAADKAMALRMNDVVVDHVTGPDCSLAPSKMEYKCRQRFDVLIRNGVFKRYDLVLLADRWNDAEEVADFARELDYWKGSGARLAIFGPMPEFGHFAERTAYHVGQGSSRVQAASLSVMDERKLAETQLPLRRIAESHGLEFVDTAAYFCALSGQRDCAPVTGQEYLVVDYGHLSETGAKLFGSRITTDLRLPKAPRHVQLEPNKRSDRRSRS